MPRARLRGRGLNNSTTSIMNVVVDPAEKEKFWDVMLYVRDLLCNRRHSQQQPRVVSDSCIDFTCHLPEISNLLNLLWRDL